MEAYSGFAEVYDLFMDNVPYGEWCRYLAGLLRDFGVEEGLVLDLGCGTGTMTELLAGAGYDMICTCCRICGSLNSTAPCGRWSPSATPSTTSWTRRI